MWNLPDEHAAEYPGSAANADSSARSLARVRSDQPTTCFICHARDTIDQEISARWLTARLTNHTSPISQSQLFGVYALPGTRLADVRHIHIHVPYHPCGKRRFGYPCASAGAERHSSRLCIVGGASRPPGSSQPQHP